MKQEIKLVAICFIFSLLAACSLFALQPAQSFDDKLGYAYATTTGLRTSAATALDANLIQVSDAQNILKVTDQARDILDQARSSKTKGDVSTATGKLTLATGLLTQLKNFLTERGVK